MSHHYRITVKALDRRTRHDYARGDLACVEVVASELRVQRLASITIKPISEATYITETRSD